MRKSNRILRSNAPPLPASSGSNGEYSSRILLEHSGNRQHFDRNTVAVPDDGKHDALQFPDQQYSPTVEVVSNDNVPVFHRQLIQPIKSPRRLYCGAWPRGYNPYIDDAERALWGDSGRAAVEAEAAKLLRRFYACDAFAKYRAKQRKDEGRKDEPVWPEELEVAFCKGLVRWPPVGRKKHMRKYKLRGRNELISDFIESLTHKTRDRKQVMSHMQVLKPLVQGDPVIMKYMPKEGGKEGRGDGSSRKNSSHGCDYTSGRRASDYPVLAPPYAAEQIFHPQKASVSHFSSFELQKLRHDLALFQPVEFEIFIQRIYRDGNNDERAERLHTYTRSVPQPLCEGLQPQDWQEFAQMCPLVADTHLQSPFKCNVLMADASLAIPTELYRDVDGVELGISLLCSSQHLPATTQMKGRNSFFLNGKLLEVKDPTEIDITLGESGHGSSVDCRLRFGSNFWAKQLSDLAKRLNSLATTNIQNTEIDAALRSINAIQEIFVMTDHGLDRVLLIHWTFRQSSTVQGRTSWARVVIPPVFSQPHGLPSQRSAKDDFDFNTPLTRLSIADSANHPSLQSPFKYESNQASSLAPSTWPTNISDPSRHTMPCASLDSIDGANNGTMRFNNSIMIAANNDAQALHDYGSSAYSFAASAAGADGYITADRSMQQYSQPWYSHCSDSQASTQDSFAMDSSQTLPGAGLQADNLGCSYDSFDINGGAAAAAAWAGRQDQQVGRELDFESSANSYHPLVATADESYSGDSQVGLRHDFLQHLKL